jgi:hypothetical protein
LSFVIEDAEKLAQAQKLAAPTSPFSADISIHDISWIVSEMTNGGFKLKCNFEIGG